MRFFAMDEPAILLSDQAGSALIGSSRATWWRRVKDGTLPPPIKIGGMTRWWRHEIIAAIELAAAERDRERGDVA
jgi:predicted DNA-binding transcriptional regulator AlpA